MKHRKLLLIGCGLGVACVILSAIRVGVRHDVAPFIALYQGE